MSDHSKIIIECLDPLCSKISDVKAVFRKCVSKSVITSEEFDSIREKNSTSMDQIEELCLLLRRKGSQAFGNFIVILRDTGNVEAADLLDKGQTNAPVAPTPAGSTSQSSSTTASNQPSDTAGPTVSGFEVTGHLVSDTILVQGWSKLFHALESDPSRFTQLSNGFRNINLPAHDLFSEIISAWVSSHDDSTIETLCKILRKDNFKAVANRLEENYSPNTKII